MDSKTRFLEIDDQMTIDRESIDTQTYTVTSGPAHGNAQ